MSLANKTPPQDILQRVFEESEDRIRVTAEIDAGDIQIGAVEIKDHDSATRLDVELDVSKNALFVQSESLAQEATLSALKTENDANLNDIEADVESIKATLQDKSQLTKLTDGVDDPVAVIPAQTFPLVAEKALAVSGQTKIFDSNGNPIDENNPLPTQDVQGAQGTVFAVSANEVNIASAAIDNTVFYLLNPTGNTKVLKGVEITTGAISQNKSAKFNFYLAATVTANGTPLTPVLLDTTAATVSTMQAFSTPTVSVLGAPFNTVNSAQNGNSFVTSFKQAVILAPGRGLVVTAKGSTSNTAVTISAVWAEV